MKKVLEQTACPNLQCGSSDAFTIYLQGDGSIDATCYSCGYFTKSPYEDLASDANTEFHGSSNSSLVNTTEALRPVTSHPSEGKQKVTSVQEALDHPIRELRERNILFPTCERFGVRVGVDTRDGTTPVYYLFPTYKNSRLSGFNQKFVPSKQFAAVGDCRECEPFGFNLIPESGKKLFITEGPEDAMKLSVSGTVGHCDTICAASPFALQDTK